MSAAAWSTPFFICAPVAALGPVIGPPMASLTCAVAVPAIAIAEPKARPSTTIFFICVPLRNEPAKSNGDNATSGRPAAPAQGRHLLVEPAIVGDHLRGAGGPKPQESEEHAGRGVDQIIVRRQQGAAEQAEVEEAYRGAEDEGVEGHLPPRPPGSGNGAAGQERGAAAQEHGDQQEDAERAFLVDEFGDAHALFTLRMILSENRFPLFG